MIVDFVPPRALRCDVTSARCPRTSHRLGNICLLSQLFYSLLSDETATRYTTERAQSSLFPIFG
ncbi:hypothetical protein E2C01_040133 [Portunus trituberculatus]|uniref:Uncharacterized protein n=1 Tax=Portunus trituberculatus TaxID=210409 RepID=A0A5B7FMT3_PORTR|nr:hypothetical protein [Portunus trituberculatus]